MLKYESMRIPDIDYTDYARLLIKTGLALKENQNITIKFEAGGLLLARRCAEMAYEQGAALVQLQFEDPKIKKARLRSQAGNNTLLAAQPGWTAKWEETVVEEQWASLVLKSFDHPHLMDDVDSSLVATFERLQLESIQRYRSAVLSHAFPWTVCAVPSDDWAQQVLGSEKKAEDLWGILRPILLLDREDPSEAWREKILTLKKRRDFFQSLELDSIRFEDEDTNLTIGINPDAFWSGGGIYGKKEIQMPNIPTEEVFTTPDFRRTEGYVKTTRPVEILGTQVKGIHLRFKNGVVIDYQADEGEAVLKEFIDTDQGARRLGEVALVGSDSPIAASALTFNSILFDENAACHIALGAGYSNNIKNADKLIDQQSKEEAGCNHSLVHVDFMIGSPTTSVTGMDKNGHEIPLMRQGNFV